jgi:hypothetical protein
MRVYVCMYACMHDTIYVMWYYSCHCVLVCTCVNVYDCLGKFVYMYICVYMIMDLYSVGPLAVLSMHTCMVYIRVHFDVHSCIHTYVHVYLHDHSHTCLFFFRRMHEHLIISCIDVYLHACAYIYTSMCSTTKTYLNVTTIRRWWCKYSKAVSMPSDSHILASLVYKLNSEPGRPVFLCGWCMCLCVHPGKTRPITIIFLRNSL